MIKVRLRNPLEATFRTPLPASFQNPLQFVGPYDKVDFRDLFQNLLAISFHQATGDDQLFGSSGFLVFRHFQDGVNRFTLGRRDECASVDDDDFGFLRARSQLVSLPGQHSKHHLAVHKVLRTTEADHSNFNHIGAIVRASSNDSALSET